MNRNASEAAVKLLKFKNYSQQELEQKLLKKGYDEVAVAEAVEYVTKRGYLNDAALCDMLVERYVESNKYSLKETYLRLRRRGLSSALIKEKLTNWDVNLEYQAAIKAAMKYLQGNQTYDLHKIIRRLAAKGFNTATVNKVLQHLRDMSP